MMKLSCYDSLEGEHMSLWADSAGDQQGYLFENYHFRGSQIDVSLLGVQLKAAWELEGEIRVTMNYEIRKY